MEKGELGIGCTVQPLALALDIDAGFVGMDQPRCRKLRPDPSVKGFQPVIGILVEIVDRTNADRNLYLLPEMIPDTVVGEQLELGHVDSVDLDPDAVLYRPGDPFGEGRHMAVAALVLENLGPVFGDDSRDVQIHDLPGLVADLAVVARRQGTAIKLEHFDFIGIGDRLQRCAATPWLPSRLAVAFGSGLLLTIRISRWRLAAVLAVQAKAVGKQRDQEQKDLKTRLDRRGQILLLGQQRFHLLNGRIDVDIVNRHSGHPC